MQEVLGSRRYTIPQVKVGLALTDYVLGNWIGNVSIPDQSIFTKERRLNSKDKDHFVDFMRKMLQWKPEDRHDLNDVFLSEWLVADLIESGQVIRDNE